MPSEKPQSKADRPMATVARWRTLEKLLWMIQEWSIPNIPTKTKKK